MEIFFLLCERLEIPTNEILKVLEFDLATEKKEYFKLNKIINKRRKYE